MWQAVGKDRPSEGNWLAACHQQWPKELTVLLVEGGLARHARVHLIRLHGTRKQAAAVSGSERRRQRQPQSSRGGMDATRLRRLAVCAAAHRLRGPRCAAVLATHPGASGPRAGWAVGSRRVAAALAALLGVPSSLRPETAPRQAVKNL